MSILFTFLAWIKHSFTRLVRQRGKTMELTPPPAAEAFLASIGIQDAKNAVHELYVRHQSSIPNDSRVAFGNLQSRLYERIRDMEIILTRLYVCGAALNHAYTKVCTEFPGGTPVGRPPDPGYVQGMKKVSEHTDELKLDMESLVLFGSMLIDDWSRAVALAHNLLSGIDTQLEILLNTLQGHSCPPALTRLQDKQGSAAVYLWLAVRVYRNQMVAHHEQPWTRGRAFAEAVPSFMLSRTLPRELLDLKTASVDIEAMRAKFDLPPITPENPWDVLLALHDRTSLIRTQADREEIARYAAKYGAISPSYQILGRRLVEFVVNASALC
jgi:hypothetical protein